jgi:hypothetical protein
MIILDEEFITDTDEGFWILQTDIVMLSQRYLCNAGICFVLAPPPGTKLVRSPVVAGFIECWNGEHRSSKPYLVHDTTVIGSDIRFSRWSWRRGFAITRGSQDTVSGIYHCVKIAAHFLLGKERL